MGSYLTVVNDTKDPWTCKVGPNMSVLKWVTLAAAVVAIAAAVIATAGYAAPAVAGLATGLATTGTFTIFSVPVAALSATTAAAATFVVSATTFVVSTASAIGLAIAQGMIKKLNDKGYDLIEAGQRKRHGKMTLSLMQQSACKRTTVDGPKLYLDTLYMRPIFSGSKNKSNRDHNIQWWLDKKGFDRETIEASPDPPPESARLLTELMEEDEDVVYSTK